jgi:DNA-3-methyladenine glycosylase II
MIPSYWQQASSELATGDSVMAGFVDRFGSSSLVSRGDPFVTLARSIVGQQISVKAADSVWTRFATALPAITPVQVLAAPPEMLRSCGLSARKVEYIGDLARHFEVRKSSPN